MLYSHNDSILHLDHEFGAIGVVARAKPATHILLDDGLRHEQADSRSRLRPLGGKLVPDRKSLFFKNPIFFFCGDKPYVN
jgi:hypothetical protein